MRSASIRPTYRLDPIVAIRVSQAILGPPNGYQERLPTWPWQSLASDLHSVLGVLRLHRAGAGHHFLDLLIRNHHRPGAVGKHVEARDHPHPRDDDGNVCLEWRHVPSAPLRRLARAVGGEVIGGELVEVPEASVREHPRASVLL